jgi:hypothetical protein
VTKEPMRDIFALLSHDALGGGSLMKRLSEVGEGMMGGLFGQIASPTEALTPLHSSSCPSTPPSSGSSLASGSEANYLSPLMARHRDCGNPYAPMGN